MKVISKKLIILILSVFLTGNSAEYSVKKQRNDDTDNVAVKSASTIKSLKTIATKYIASCICEQIYGDPKVFFSSDVINTLPTELASNVWRSCTEQSRILEFLSKRKKKQELDFLTINKFNDNNISVFTIDRFSNKIAIAANNIVRVYNSSDLQNHISQIEQNEYVHCLEFSNDGKYLLVEIEETAQIYRLDNPTFPIIKLSDVGYYKLSRFSLSDKFILSGFQDHNQTSIFLYFLGNLDEIETIDSVDKIKVLSPIILSGHAEHIYSFEFSPNEEYVLSSSGDGTVKSWPLENVNSETKLISSKDLINETGRTNFIFSKLSPCGILLAIVDDKKIVQIYDVNDLGKAKLTFSVIDESHQEDGVEENLISISTMCFSNNNKYLFIGFDNGSGVIINLKDDERHEIKRHKGEIKFVFFTPCDEFLVVVPTNDFSSIYNISADRIRSCRFKDKVYDIKLASDSGSYIFAGLLHDGGIKLWRLGALPATLQELCDLKDPATRDAFINGQILSENDEAFCAWMNES